MSVFFRQIQHLLPRSKTWALAVDRTLRRFFLGIAGSNEEHVEFVDSVHDDLWPLTTRELSTWEEQHGIGNTLLDEDGRRTALAGAWVAQGGQSLEYIQDTLQANGFDVYLHPCWVANRLPGELSGLYYTDRTLDASSADTTTSGICFNRGGSKFYAVGEDGDIVSEWDLSTEYRIDSATASGNTLDVTAQATSPEAIFLGNKDQTIFVLDLTTASVYQYDLTIAGDLSTASYSGNSFSVGSQQATPYGLAFKPDGTRFYVCGTTSALIFEYELSTAWDLSTASYQGTSGDTLFATGKRGISFTSDGAKFMFCSTSTVYEFDLTTAWDISTFSYTGESHNPSEIGATVSDIWLGGNGGLGVGYDNGTTLFISSTTDDIYQYSLADYEPRDPNDYLTNPLLGTTQCGEDLAECGEAAAVCGTEIVGDPDYIVNLDLTVRAPPLLPTDRSLFPYFFYVGGATFGDTVTISENRRAEFERVLLKLRPNNNWIGTFIDYVDELTLEGGDFLLTESGDVLSLE